MDEERNGLQVWKEKGMGMGWRDGLQGQGRDRLSGEGRKKNEEGPRRGEG